MNIFVNMVSVVVIGYGNVGYHLVDAFLKATEVQLVQVYNRNLSKIEHLNTETSITNDLHNLKEADIYIIAVPDDVIGKVSSEIKNKTGIIAHTSGASLINKLQTSNPKAVFYPLQSFSKEKAVDFNEIPFCLESEHKQDYKVVEQLAKAIGERIYAINSEQRKALHVAAVFVNNFTNHLFKIGNDICLKNNVPFDVLHPLIKETALKIEKLAPKEAQTGPAIRNDQQTIANHLELLNDKQKTIYKLLTQSIQNG